MNLSRDTVPVVAGVIREVLQGYDKNELVGVTCLAQGSDQIFARAVLEHGGAVEVILPALDYRERKIKPDNLAEFDELIDRARTVRTLPFEKSSREAYVAANREVLGSIDSLIAVWDGGPPEGQGGTSEVVRVARNNGLPVTVVWPEGARRD